MLHRFKRTEVVVSAIRADDEGMVEIPGRGSFVAGVGKWVTLEADGSLAMHDHADFLRDYEPADATARSYLEAMKP